MKWTETVSMLSDRVTKQIISEHGKQAEDLSFLLDPQYVQLCWDRFSVSEQEVINYFLLEKGEDFITYRELEQEGHPLAHAKYRVSLTKLRRLGFVFTLRRMWGEQAYGIPRELLTLFRQILVAEQVSWESSTPLMASLSYHILEDILQAVNNVRYTPLELTKKATITKKSMRQLVEGCHLPIEALAAMAKQAVTVPPYQEHEVVFLDMLLKWELLQVEPTQVQLGDMESWVNRSFAELQNQCLDLLASYMELCPRLQFYWDITRNLKSRQPYSLEAILASMGRFAPARDKVIKNWLQPLEQLGLLYAQTVGTDTIWAWNIKEEIGSSIYVQPNFDVILPSYSSMRLKWELLAFTRVSARAEMWTLALDRYEVQRYIENGGSASELVSRLEQNSATPIPPSIVNGVSTWAQEAQQISFVDCRLMVVSHPDLAADMERIASISRHLQGKIGDRTFIVSVAKWQELQEELEKRGYLTGTIKNLLEEKEAKEPAKLHLFKATSVLTDYQVDSVFPDLEDAIPGLRQLPKMWLANYSQYHESTLREMIQQASLLRLELQLQWKGKDYRLYPQSIVNKNGYWFLQSFSEDQGQTQEISLREIGNIKILQP
ncbi:hypothetical protein [Ammoniphilus sp. YIM 78166]|uniref:hypothetical protein n=1 Tax=Ammoniphilus sp. YIM 78166 TaxID=1644106 RepID=UPI00107003D9|nr:hypothetical protein [Ammoniphilus sp. YIM 78166]